MRRSVRRIPRERAAPEVVVTMTQREAAQHLHTLTCAAKVFDRLHLLSDRALNVEEADLMERLAGSCVELADRIRGELHPG